MKSCKLCIHWTGKVYCERNYYIVNPAGAEQCRDYLELADELVRIANEGGYYG